MKEVGKVLWHSLDESGNISVYDVDWPISGVQVNVPASMLEGVKMTEHENEGEAHGVQAESMPVSERVYKK